MPASLMQSEEGGRRRRLLWTLAAGLSGALLAGLALAAVFAPYVDAELWPALNPHQIVEPGPAKIAAGRMVDDYFVVQDLGGGTFAIGEPRYYQQNYVYLITGRDRALLFDSGSGTRNLAPVVRALTSLPVIVMVSHLHFDHYGGVGQFERLAMIDLPQTRADYAGGVFRPSRYQFMGMFDHMRPAAVPIAQWVKPGERIDLGGRTITVMSTPGHTPTSISLYDPAARRLFTGDFLYPTTLYAFLPGASLSAYDRTARSLLAAMPQDTRLYGAHCCRSEGGGAQAPWLTMSDLRDLQAALAQVASGRSAAKGFYPRTYPVNREMTLAAGFPWTNR